MSQTKKNIMTYEGIKKLEEELEYLKTVRRKEITEKIKHHFLYSQNGKGTPGHIRIPEAEQMSKELTAFIESLGEEIWDM